MTDKDILISDLNDISEILINNGYGGWYATIRKAVDLLKEQEEQKRKWLQNIADNQLANAPMDGCCLEQWNYQKGVYDGLQMAYDILTEGR